MRRTPRSRAVLALGAGAFVAAWLLGSLPLTVVGVGLVAAGLAARWWVRALRGEARLHRRGASPQNIEGDDVRVAYRVERRSRLPAGAAYVRERIGQLGETYTRLRGGRGELLLYAVPRGRYPFDDVAVVLEDPLGLEQIEIPAQAGPPLLVVPRIAELPGLFSESGRHGSAGRRLLLRRPSGFDLHSVREYEVGESLRKVHWPTTARRGQLMVKELEESPRDDVVILLDCDPTAVVGPAGASSFDEQVRAAGSILRAHVARGMRSVLVLARKGAPTIRISSLEDWPLALEALAAAEPDGGLSLLEVLADDRGAAARAPELTVVTAQLEPRAVDRIAYGVAGKRVSVVWVDAASYAGRQQPTPSLALLRLAGVGVPVAVIRRGDQLASVLAGDTVRRRSA